MVGGCCGYGKDVLAVPPLDNSGDTQARGCDSNEGRSVETFPYTHDATGMAQSALHYLGTDTQYARLPDS